MTFRRLAAFLPVAALLILWLGGCGDALVDPDTRKVKAADLNDPPVAVNDSSTVVQGVPTVLHLLRNDLDPDGLLDTASLVLGTPAHGSISANADSTVTYTADWTFVGVDTFTYTVADDFGVRSAPATVRITVLLGPPKDPEPLTPEDGAENVPATVPFSWGPSPQVLEYEIVVSTAQDFSTIAFSSIQPDRTADVPLDRGQTYYWRVRGINLIGAGNWSPVRSFTTVPNAPPVPQLLSPVDGASGIGLGSELQWEPIVHAHSYRLQVADNVAFAGAIVDETVEQASFVLPAGGLEAGVRYFWRVRGINEGGPGPWSPSWSFVTEVVPPQAPLLLAPDDGAVNQPLNPMLRWQRVPDATTYRLQVARDMGFTDVVHDRVDSTTVRILPDGPLAYQTTYYWRVRSGNVAGPSPWSEVRNFTTSPPIPVAPALVSPADQASGLALTPALSWSSSPGAERYRVQVATLVTFAGPVLDVETTETQVNVPSGSLQAGTRYFWRVRAINAGGLSGWSATRAFETSASTLTPK